MTALPPNNIRKIVIVGGGTAGWMAAAAMSKILIHPDIEITLVESDQIGTVGVGEATIPHIQYFNELLGLDEDSFVKQTNATFKLGIEFVDWDRKGRSYIHPFGEYGVDMEGMNFHHFWLRHQRENPHDDVDDYNLQIMAARAGKFQRPLNIPNSPLNKIAYAFHFDATLYARFMRGFAEQRGVKRIEGKVVDVRQNSETGFVETLGLEDGQTIDGEFFIDCSGFRGLLIEQTLKAGFDDWSDVLPCNRAVTVACEKIAEPIPYTRSTAKTAGWQWRIPLQSRTGNGYVYCADYISDDEATQTLLDGLDADPIGEPRFIRFRTGLRKEPWKKNVFSLGLAAGFMEPLESTSIHLIQTAVARLLTHFPDKNFDQAGIDFFNERTRLEFERIRDFLVLHYCATERDDSPFWNYCRTMPIPATLQQRIDLYQSAAHVYRIDHELFGDVSWFAVMHGQGLVPRANHPNADMMPLPELDRRMSDIKRTWANCLAKMPTHQQFIDNNCRAL